MKKLLELNNYFYFQVDCSWSDWVYEECDCDTKVRLVTRVQYEEEYGGKPCEGESQMSMPCDETECPGTIFIEVLLFQSKIKTIIGLSTKACHLNYRRGIMPKRM